MNQILRTVNLFAITLLASVSSMAQVQLQNADFELWDNPSSANAEPVNWNSNKTGAGFANLGPQTLWRESSIVHGGTYSARIKTGTYFGTTVNGVMTTGQVNAPSTTPSQGYNATVPTDANFSTPLTATPDSFVFWAYYVQGGTDQARCSAILHSNYAQRDPFANDPNGSTNVIAAAQATFGGTSSAWVRKSFPFDYATYNNPSAPAYILVTFTSSYVPGSGSTSSTLYIDDAQLIYNPTLSTGTISPLTYYISGGSGASISVPFTLTGTMNPGNVVTAQLSDANGSFASPVNIGSLTTTTSGTINGTIPAGTAVGTGYRVRVVSSSYPLTATDNGQNISIQNATNFITPAATQNLQPGVDGTELTINENPAAASREWKFSTTPGGPYSNFTPSVIGLNYTPNFAAPGTYYIVCVSDDGNGNSITSNEVVIVVANGTNLNTSTISGSPFFVSPSSNVTVSVGFTSDITFGANNVFTAQLSNASGSFANPVTIGTLTSSATGTPISAVIPSGTPNGTGYRIRVVSSNPAFTGTDNGANLTAIQFENSIAPIDTQFVLMGTNGTTLNVTATHPGTSQVWKFRPNTLVPYGPFTPAQTGTSYTPNFPTDGFYFIACFSVNTWGDTTQSEEVVVRVFDDTGVENEEIGKIAIYQLHEGMVVDLTQSSLVNPLFQLIDMTGKVVLEQKIMTGTIQNIAYQVPSGVYAFRLSNAKQLMTGKILLR